MTGITISTKQVEIANRLTKAALENEASTPAVSDDDGFIKLGDGQVKFLELDAEKMGDFFDDQQGSFDAIWISEALSHFPNKALFFKNVMKILKPGGKLVLADWFKAENLDDTTFTNDIKPIEGKVPRKTLVFLSLDGTQMVCSSHLSVPSKAILIWLDKLGLPCSPTQKTSANKFERRGT